MFEIIKEKFRSIFKERSQSTPVLDYLDEQDLSRFSEQDIILETEDQIQEFLPEVLGQALARTWIDKRFLEAFYEFPEEILERGGVYLPDHISVEFMKKNKMKQIKKNLKIFTLLIKPNFGCSTKNIYAQVRNYSKPQFFKIKSKNINFNTLSKMKNDLEVTSFKLYPRLRKLRQFFLNIDKNSYVRMTGSGSTIVGYFMSKKAALNAKKLLKKKYKNYWCNLSKTI